jgi:hypothetical protein
MMQGKNIGDLLNAKNKLGGGFKEGSNQPVRQLMAKPTVIPLIRTLLTRTSKITASTTNLFSITNPRQILIIYLLLLLQ